MGLLKQLKKPCFLALFFLFTSFSTYAQNNDLSGIVVDGESKEVIEGASVTLLTERTQTFIRGTQTQSNGSFLFEDLVKSKYVLRVSYVGYQTYELTDLNYQGGPRKLDSIFLQPAGEVLEEVMIEGRVPELRLDIDKKVFDASQSIVSEGGTASDLLENVPTLEVDVDGNVSLRGSSSVKILIDGKESAMAGNDIANYLQSMPANLIDKVELITNPSSRYDAEGQSGIVNIVLKKNVRTGLNGSVNASWGSYNNQMAGINLNYRNRKLNYSGGYSYARRSNKGSGYNDNVFLNHPDDPSMNPRTITESSNNRRMYNHTVRTGVDYYMHENTTVSLGANISFRDRNSSSLMDYTYYNLPAYGANSLRKSNQNGDSFGVDLSLDFVQNLKREGEEIFANVTFGKDNREGYNDYFQDYASGRADFVRLNNTTDLGYNWNFQFDYTLPLGEDHKFEAGYRGILRNGEENQFSELQDTISLDFVPDYGVSNDFDLNSSVHALYTNYQRKLSDRLGVQIGLRAEQANLNTKYYSLDPEVDESERITPGKLDYFRLYPSVFLSYDLSDEGDKLQWSYSRRVQRPRGWQVNPFLNLSDETNIMQGNPELLPEDIHSFEMAYAKFFNNWNIMSSVYYRRVNDMTSPFLKSPSLIGDAIGDTTNVTYSQWDNVANQDVFGLELISKVSLFNWWDATANVNLFYNNTTPLQGFDVQEVENFSWNGNLNSNVKIMRTLSMQLRGFYRAPSKRLQGRMKAMYGMDVALKKEVLDGKGSITFNVRDAFDTRSFRSESFLPQNHIYMEHRWRPRTFTVSLSYRFGSRDVSESKSKRERMEDMGGEMEGMGEF